MVISYKYVGDIRGLITPRITTHEPPSTASSFKCSSTGFLKGALQGSFQVRFRFLKGSGMGFS